MKQLADSSSYTLDEIVDYYSSSYTLDEIVDYLVG